MNTNVKEIGHLSFKLKNTQKFRQFYENELKLPIGFILKTPDGEDRIIYYQLDHGQFIEIFPETKQAGWPDYDGHNHDEYYSYQYTTLGIGEGKTIQDPEFNTWKVNEGEQFISKVTYHSNDIKKVKDFYVNILNLDVVLDTPDCVHIKVNDEQIIEILNKPYPKDNCTNNKGQCHYALIVEDIELSARRLEAKGIQLYHGPKTMHMPYTEPYEKVPHSENSYNFYIQDPDDNEIEVMSYSPESFQLVYAKKVQK